MRKLKFSLIFTALAAFVFLGSCTSVHQSMREPIVHVEFEKDDFEVSEQITAEAQSTKIIGIDFARLFKQESATAEGPSSLFSLASIPVVGNVVTDKTSNYALYKMMQENPGYDVVLYPQFHTTVKKPIGIGTIFSITTVKATARLGKLKE